MRIDLHCHTKQIKKGDGSGRNVSAEVFRQKVIDADVKIIAITNHNVFDYEQFTLFKNTVSDVCQLWPGVEIDIQQPNSRKWHLIVVANPDNVQIFSEHVKNLFQGQNLETCTHTIQEVYDALNDCDTIYIAHFHKSPAISDEDRKELRRIVGDISRIFDEPADNRSLGVFANYGYNVLIGSDVKNWENYPQSTFSDLRLPVANFHQFCMLAKRDTVIINTLLGERKSYSLIASPHKSVKFPLTIYEDVNIIFGQKGTGKSEILQSLYDQMLTQGIDCRKYTASEKDNDFNSLMKTTDMKGNVAVVNANECENEFKQIFEWADTNPTLFTNYINWYSTKDNVANKSRMQITNSSELVEPEPANYQVYLSDHERINDVCKKLDKINYSLYFDDTDTDLFKTLLNKLKLINQENLTADIIQLKAVELVNYSLTKIKSIADKNSNTVSKPASTGFREFVTNRLELYKNTATILKNLAVSEYNERSLLGSIDGKGNIYINSKYRMLCDESKTAEFSMGITKLREIQQKLKEISTKVFSANIALIVSELTNLCNESSVSSTNIFLGRSKQIISEEGIEYHPSNGEKGILLLQQALADGADAYFLDEPELGMGNSYIDTSIRPIISGLAKQHKTVVIATHNANIAVRTLPYMSIYRTHQNGIYKTYTGNPFDDRLINIDDENDIKSWTTESLHTLEGGKEAFYERKNIYETNGTEKD